MLTIIGKNNANGDFDWRDALLDALISAGLTFFTTLGGIAVTQLVSNPTSTVIAAGVAAGGQFFAILAVKRGLREKQQTS